MSGAKCLVVMMVMLFCAGRKGLTFLECAGITPDWLFEIGGNRFVAVVVKPLVSLSRFRNITK